MKRIITLSLLAFIILINILSTGCAKLSELNPGENKQKEETVPEKDTKQDSNEIVPALKPGDFFPLSAGLSWEYQGEGNEYASFNRKVLFVKDNLAQIREDNGGTVSASVFETTNEAVTRVFFLGEAYGEENYLDSKPNENIVILKEPLKVGTKWEDPNGVREIVDVNSSVSTPAGDFEKCIKVKISNENSILYEYFKQGIGMVNREFISGETRVTSSLKKFK